jgi:hypothetical protein
MKWKKSDNFRKEMSKDVQLIEILKWILLHVRRTTFLKIMILKRERVMKKRGDFQLKVRDREYNVLVMYIYSSTENMNKKLHFQFDNRFFIVESIEAWSKKKASICHKESRHSKHVRPHFEKP